jgi:5-methylcytosine-specific restriction endonuclease McrA
MNFTQTACNYTEIGRETIYKKLKPDIAYELQRMTRNIYENNKVELADNKLSTYSAQKGKCAITGIFLKADMVEIHHKKPVSLGGTDDYANLTAVHKDAHKLIHASVEETIERYKLRLQLNVKQLKKLNTYRSKCNLIKLV